MALELSTKIPEVKDVIEQVRELSADEKLRREAFYREKRLHDEANAINGSRREGIKIGRTEERNKIIDIMRLQGYSEEQINNILGAIN